MKKALSIFLIALLCFSMFSCDIEPDTPEQGTDGEIENTSPESDTDPIESGDKTIDGNVTEPESETEFVRPDKYVYVQDNAGKLNDYFYLEVNGEPVGGMMTLRETRARIFEDGPDGIYEQLFSDNPFYDPPSRKPVRGVYLTYRPEEEDEVTKPVCLKGEVRKDEYYVWGVHPVDQTPLTTAELVPGKSYCRIITIYVPIPEGGVTEAGYYGYIEFAFVVNIV